MTVADLKRELLVRHLETWAPTALRRGRRAVYLHGHPDVDAAAAVRVCAEQEPGRGRELVVVVLGGSAVVPDVTGVTVHAVPGDPAAMAGPAIKAAGASGVPLLGFFEGLTALSALGAGRPAEVLLTCPSGTDVRPALLAAGFPLVTEVELATGPDDPSELLVFGTGLAKRLEAFKETLWAVDEFAGVRYRDPGDPGRHLIDISLSPHPGPLRRELTAHLTAAGGRATVTELRTYAMTATIYRAADASRILHTMLDAGEVTRDPEPGRLGGEVVISLV